MLHTSELDMAKMVKPSDIDVFLSDTAWAVCSTYHTVLKASPGAAIFIRDMLFDIPFIAGWQKIGEHRQRLTDLNNARENENRIDYIRNGFMPHIMGHKLSHIYAREVR